MKITTSLLLVAFSAFSVAHAMVPVETLAALEASMERTPSFDANEFLCMDDDDDDDDRILSIDSTLQLQFLQGQEGRAPTEQEIQQLVEETESFLAEFVFSRTGSSKSTTSHHDDVLLFDGLEIVQSRYDYATSEAFITLNVNFIEEDDGNSQDLREAMTSILRTASVQDHIDNFAWGAAGSKGDMPSLTHSATFRVN